MTVATAPSSLLLPQASAFQKFLVDTQKMWASSLATLETQSQWQVEHRPSSTHDSVIYHMTNGHFIEKGAINYSCIHAKASDAVAKATKAPSLSGQYFVGMGISMIIHPRNPFVPTVHANLRYFQSLSEHPLWWFAGVIDLTPTYGFREDCQHWHRICQQACHSIDYATYLEFKTACDRYYHLPHRNEHRGIGGLWIEQLNQPSFTACQQLIQSIGSHFSLAYLPICEKRLPMPYNASQKDFQNYRRGRYVEFNLLYDRGTQFGLSMGSRSESILVSMPPCAHWIYDWQAQPDSPEAELTSLYLQPHDWLSTA